MLTGLNHLTLTVRDLSRSLEFYQTALHFRLKTKWSDGAYLTLNDLWLCLSRDDNKAVAPAVGYTHYAFSISQDDFYGFTEHLRQHGVNEWKINQSEGDSFYFLDPDGHKLEAHVGTLETRLEQCRLRPYQKMEFFD